jgi:hypothetical protein
VYEEHYTVLRPWWVGPAVCGVADRQTLVPLKLVAGVTSLAGDVLPIPFTLLVAFLHRSPLAGDSDQRHDRGTVGAADHH